MPFAYTSPNAIPPAHTLVALTVSVVPGARHLAHTDWLCADKPLHALVGIPRFPGTGTVRNLLAQLPISPAIVVSPGTSINENDAWARLQLKLQGWAAPREFFAIRERVRENKSAVGRRLIEVKGNNFRVWVTNRQGNGTELWCNHNQRACMEQHIEELKNDLQADGFCMQVCFATESAFLAVCFTYNLLSVHQYASAPEQRKTGFRRPATLRAAVFIGGAVLGNRSLTPVLDLAENWRGLDKHKPLMDNILRWLGASSPKLPSEPPEPPDVDETALPSPAHSDAT